MKKDLLILSASTLLVLIIVIFFSLANATKEKVGSSAPVSCVTDNFSGQIIQGEKIAIFEGEKIEIPELAMENSVNNVLGLSHEERWIEVDLSEQKLKAWEGSSLFLETPISSGLPWWPTPQGEFRIWIKLRATKMSGGTGRNYYYLPNVPYVMYFENSEIPSWRGYGLHGTYWHSDFGNPRSHGCVNLPTPIAGQLYYWVSPVLPEGKSSIRASTDNPGTRIVIHD